MLDQMFDFEKKIAQHTKVSAEKFMKSGSYLFLRSGMIERWKTLNKFYTYPNMLTPLKTINSFKIYDTWLPCFNNNSSLIVINLFFRGIFNIYDFKEYLYISHKQLKQFVEL